MLAESWLRRPLSDDNAPEELIVRYLGAFGPASVRDVQQWSGLTKLRAVMEALRPQLRVFRNESGTELFDLPDAPLPGAETPAPVRFLPEYDNLILAYADRTRVISDANRLRITLKNGIAATVLVNGMVAGRWRVERTRGVATLVVESFTRFTKQDRLELHEEGARLLDFTDADATTRDVRVTAAS